MNNYVKEMLKKRVRERFKFDKYCDLIACREFKRAVYIVAAFDNNLRIQYDTEYGWTIYEYSDFGPPIRDPWGNVLWIDRIKSNLYRVHGVKTFEDGEREFNNPCEENFELMTYEQVLDCVDELEMNYEEDLPSTFYGYEEQASCDYEYPLY